MAIKVSGVTVVDDNKNLTNITNINISGISTVGSFKINSGIITAVSGVVTYYGDGSNLVGAGISEGVGQRSSIINSMIFG
jgi:hypothetical protein